MIGSEEIHAIGYLHVLIPAMVGPLVLLVAAPVVNNIPATRRYPEVWM